MKKLILLLIACILIFFIAIVFIVNNNLAYKSDLLKEISKNYHHEVLYANKYGNNYIIKTKDKIVVLDKEYKEITSENIEEVKKLDYEIVYKKNIIMYQKTETKDKNILYTYYDIKTGQKLDELEIEG